MGLYGPAPADHNPSLPLPRQTAEDPGDRAAELWGCVLKPRPPGGPRAVPGERRRRRVLVIAAARGVRASDGGGAGRGLR